MLKQAAPPPPSLGGGPVYTPPPIASPRQQNNLRRSDLAGWRTRSLFQPASLSTEVSGHPMFLPILKLRGLPYYCSKKHLMGWFDSLSRHVLDVLFIADVEPLNTGFALVTMDTPRAAVQAWLSLHKKPMIGKRFVEVFALFPPCCPLFRRGGAAADPLTASGLLSLPADAVSISQQQLGSPQSPGICLGNHSASDAGGICSFCGFPLAAHGDGGRAAIATARAWQLLVKAPKELRLHGLMHSGFLGIPALLYQDGGAVSRVEVDLFSPEDWSHRRRQNLTTECSMYLQSKLGPERVLTLQEIKQLVEGPRHSQSSDAPDPAHALPGDSDEFFDLMSLGPYDIRAFLCETVQILTDSARPSPSAMHWAGGLSIAEIGNLLSARARAYLFVTEIKLRNVLEQFPHLFNIAKATAQFEFSSVTLRPDVVGLSIHSVTKMEAFELTKRRKAAGKQSNNGNKRNESADKNGPRINPNTVPPPPLQRTPAHVMGDQLYDLPLLPPVTTAQPSALSSISEYPLDDFVRATSYQPSLWPPEPPRESDIPLGEWSNLPEVPVQPHGMPVRVPSRPGMTRQSRWAQPRSESQPQQINFVPVPLGNFQDLLPDNPLPPPSTAESLLSHHPGSFDFPPKFTEDQTVMEHAAPTITDSMFDDTLWIPEELEGLSLDHRSLTCPPATSYPVGSWYLNQTHQMPTNSSEGWTTRELLAILARSTSSQVPQSHAADIGARNPVLSPYGDELTTTDAMSGDSNVADGVSVADANLLLQVAQQLLSSYNEKSGRMS